MSGLWEFTSRDIGEAVRFKNDRTFFLRNTQIHVQRDEGAIIQNLEYLGQHIDVFLPTQNMRISVPGDQLRLSPITQAQVDHTFRCKADFYVQDNRGYTVSRGETGVITGHRQNGRIAVVELRSRIEKPTVEIHAGFIEVGKRSGTWKFQFNTSHTKAPAVRNTDRPTQSQHGMSPHITHVLWEIKAQCADLLAEDTMALLEDGAAVNSTCNMFVTNANAASPAILNAVMRKDFTVWDVLNACPRFNSSTDDGAGIYLRIYSDFPRGSKYDGLIFIYVGQTNCFVRRDQDHRNTARNSWLRDHKKDHYKVARAAASCKIGLLAKHDKNEGGGKKQGEARRDIMEQLWMLILGSYSQKMGDREQKMDDLSASSVGLAVSVMASKHRAYKAFRSAYEVACRKSGYHGGKPRADNGKCDGLNFSSPLGMGSNRREKTLWTLETQTDRWLFHRGAQKRLSISNPIFQIAFGDGKAISEKFGATDEENQDWPAVGDTYYIIFEAMKPDRKKEADLRASGDVSFAANAHPAPLYRVHQFSPWSNGADANKIGMRIIWQCERTERWYSRYHQAALTAAGYWTPTRSGANTRYINGTLLYSYLMGFVYPDWPFWMPGQRVSDQVSVHVDGFHQVARVEDVTLPLREEPGPQYSENVGRLEMLGIGLENVNGAWQSLGKERASCDRCYLSSCRSDIIPSCPCRRVPDKNRCVGCVLEGLPCSWTPTVKLLQSTALYHKACKGLLGFAKAEEAKSRSSLSVDPGLTQIALISESE